VTTPQPTYGPREHHQGPCPEGPSGSSTFVQQDEADILAATVQGLQTRTEGMQEPGRH
jgi:hypothetical protein